MTSRRLSTTSEVYKSMSETTQREKDHSYPCAPQPSGIKIECTKIKEIVKSIDFLDEPTHNLSHTSRQTTNGLLRY